jgi:hypothetical protein
VTRLTLRYATIVALGDLGAGCTGMLFWRRFNGNSYKPALQLFGSIPYPGLCWAALLVGLSLTALVALAVRSPYMRTAFALLMGFWGFWAVVWWYALIAGDGGPWGPWLALIAILGNSRPVVAPTLHSD